jgi:hypothetical protein
MRKLSLMRWVLFMVVAPALLAAGPNLTSADDGDVPSPHRLITEYTGPETCAQCHISAARDVVQSLHYQQQGAVPYREGWDEEVLGGMYVTY